MAIRLTLKTLGRDAGCRSQRSLVGAVVRWHCLGTLRSTRGAREPASHAKVVEVHLPVPELRHAAVPLFNLGPALRYIW